MDNPLTWGAIVLALAGIVAAVKFWMDMGATQSDAKAARETAKDAHVRIDRLAETAATNHDIAAAEKRFADAVNGMRSDFQHLVGRLDGLIAALVHKQG